MSFGGRSMPSHEHRSTKVIQNRSTSSPGYRSTTPMESTASCNAVRIMTHEDFAEKHPHPPSPIYVKIDRYSDSVIDRHQEITIDRQPPAPIDRRAPIIYRVQIGERREAARRRFRSRESDEFRWTIDAKPRTSVDKSHPKPIDILSWISIDNTYGVNRILQCREDHDSRGFRRKTPTSAQPKPKPSGNPPEAVKTPSEDETDSMEVDRVPTGRTLKRRKAKVVKHLKRRANEKETKSFRKRVFRIPLDKPFVEAYFTHRLWMFFRETRETEENIRRMFYEAREQMRKRVTLKKKSDPGEFAIPCTVKGIEFPHALINAPGIIAACHYGAEYETEYSASIETHTATSIDSAQQKSTYGADKDSVDSNRGEWENDYYNSTTAEHNMHTKEYDEYYEEERAIEQRAILDEEDRLLHHSSWKKKSPSQGTCLVVPERKLNCYSHQILQVWSVQSTKRHAPHRSTTMLVRRSILVDPGTSPVDRYSLTTVDRIHSSPVDRHLSSDIDRYFSTNIDRY
ncbi:hypothetical protein F2Q69_00007092 [Brassica cretica]|uniref:Uncharacterized protein n=1 Tax=Brassica cretica TaxID=69181 RepID=A0A8S9PAN4_BRACR|nr:hypothetical protein F2Q69_00007092 [Brassica cretica]